MMAKTVIPKLLDDPAYKAESEKLQALYDRKVDVEAKILRLDEQRASQKHEGRFTAAALRLLDGGQAEKSGTEERRKLFDELHTIEEAIEIQRRRADDLKMKVKTKICETAKPQFVAALGRVRDALNVLSQAHGEYTQLKEQLIADDSYSAHVLRPLSFSAHIHGHQELKEYVHRWTAEGKEYGMLP